MKIGIFGGCFNPPHKMHKDIVNSLINNGYLDRVIFVPTGDNYAKPELVNIDKRINMLTLISNNENILVSNISKNLQYQYTFEVLDYFQDKYPGAFIYFICGTDNLRQFENWKRAEYILTNYKLLVIMRNNDNVKEILNKYSKYDENIWVANIAQNLVSSTIVRKLVKEEKWDELVKVLDEKVLEYIKEKGLYKS